MKPRKHKRLVLLGDLEEHSIREVCQGAAEYVATRARLEFDPWAVLFGRSRLPALRDLNRVDGLLVSESALRSIGGRLSVPHVFYLANDCQPRTPAVALDEFAIGWMAADHLLQRGYCRLAFFGCRTMPWSRQRNAGFQQRAAGDGVAVLQFECPPETLPVYRPTRLRTRERKLHEALSSLPNPCGDAELTTS